MFGIINETGPRVALCHLIECVLRNAGLPPVLQIKRTVTGAIQFSAMRVMPCG